MRTIRDMVNVMSSCRHVHTKIHRPPLPAEPEPWEGTQNVPLEVDDRHQALQHQTATSKRLPTQIMSHILSRNTEIWSMNVATYLVRPAEHGLACRPARPLDNEMMAHQG
jgi:hypothetical protein